MRKSKSVSDKPRKQIEHYVNGKDATDGMHPGIRSKCDICPPQSNYWSMSPEEFAEQWNANHVVTEMLNRHI